MARVKSADRRRDHSSDLDKDVIPSSSEGQMMIGGGGSRRVVGGSLCKEAWEGTGRSAALALAGKGTRWEAPDARLRWPRQEQEEDFG